MKRTSNLILPFFAIVLLQHCVQPVSDTRGILINTAHLEHLYEEFEWNGKTLGAIWIYCEAPDYRLVDDDDEGFTCVDDVARALVFYCRQYASEPDAGDLQRIQTLSEFVLSMQAENGWFYNFMFPDKQVNTTHQNSVAERAFWAWRAFWALSELNLLRADALKGLQDRSRSAMDKLIGNIGAMCPQDAGYQAFDGVQVPECIAALGGDQAGVMMIALTNYYRIYGSAQAKELLLFYGSLLLETQFGDAENAPYHAFLSWQNFWHAWGNSQAFALLYAGRILEHQPFIEAGLNEVRHFYPHMLAKGRLHGFKLSRQEDTLRMEDGRQFPQIAYDVRPMVFAALEAYAITEEETHAQTAAQLASWLLGANPAQHSMYDPATGRTFDGIGAPEEINRNSGAESTIEALLTLQAIASIPAAQKAFKTYR